MVVKDLDTGASASPDACTRIYTAPLPARLLSLRLTAKTERLNQSAQRWPQ